MNLEGKTVLVTGGAVRIGRAICLALAGCGCRVGVHYDRSAPEARELVDAIGADGGTAYAVQGHLESKESCRQVIGSVWSAWGTLDLLVNNAAVFHKQEWLTAPMSDIERDIRTNFLVPMMLIREFAARLRGREDAGGRGGGAPPRGRIVNLLDRRIVGIDPECVPYQISKKMLAELTGAAAVDLAPDVTVNAVAPGAVLPPPGHLGGAVRDLAGPVPLDAPCTPEAVAEAVAFLLEADTITGQTLFVDGGRHLV